jgi:RNA-directed DNA polymerase
MTLQGGRQQKSLWEIEVLPGNGKGEARRVPREGTEQSGARCGDESRTGTAMLMEEVVGRENMVAALKRVRANKGSSGTDGMTVEELPDYLRAHWEEIKEELLLGRYRPQPVRRVQIPKPDGGVRDLGVPTVLDRLIQQAVMQVLQARWDGAFSEHSYGFRPGRSAHQDIAQAQEYIMEGYGWVVDIDLKKFFDRVNHDRLMSRMAERVADKRALKLVRAFLEAGVMVGGLVSATEEGVPQGGPLSPLLSNLVLARPRAGAARAPLCQVCGRL